MAINTDMHIVIGSNDNEKGKKILKNIGEVANNNKLLGKYGHRNSEEICKNLKQDIYYYDIFILDATDSSFIEIAKKIRMRNCIASIILYMGVEMDVMDFVFHRLSAVLLNDYSVASLEKIMKYVYEEQQRFHPCFPVKNKDTVLRIPYENILFFESRQKKCIIYTKEQTLDFYAKMSDVEAKLPKEEFLRCHQSYLINMKNVIRLDKTNRCFEFPKGHNIPISKANYANSVEAYEKFFERF